MRAPVRSSSLANRLTSGFDQPIVVDKDHVIIKGHGRRLAALELKMDVVPVVVRADLSPEQCMASRIADNHVQSMSKTDVVKEQQAIKDYVDLGGNDAPIFFDFMNPEAASKISVPGHNPPAATSPTPKDKPAIAGSMQACPRCQHSFLEVKK